MRWPVIACLLVLGCGSRGQRPGEMGDGVPATGVLPAPHTCAMDFLDPCYVPPTCPTCCSGSVPQAGWLPSTGASWSFAEQDGSACAVVDGWQHHTSCAACDPTTVCSVQADNWTVSGIDPDGGWVYLTGCSGGQCLSWQVACGNE